MTASKPKPTARSESFARTWWNRLVALMAVLIFVWLIVLAQQGRLDHHINKVAAWLQRVLG